MKRSGIISDTKRGEYPNKYYASDIYRARRVGDHPIHQAAVAAPMPTAIAHRTCFAIASFPLEDFQHTVISAFSTTQPVDLGATIATVRPQPRWEKL
jgi:hypothetical protein